jgi:hypothetical protein
VIVDTTSPRFQYGTFFGWRRSESGARHDFGQSPRLASQRGLLRYLTVSRSLIEFQVRVHRRGAEDTEAAQRPDSRTLRTLCGLGASAVKSRLQNYDSPKIVTHTQVNLSIAFVAGALSAWQN